SAIRITVVRGGAGCTLHVARILVGKKRRGGGSSNVRCSRLHECAQSGAHCERVHHRLHVQCLLHLLDVLQHLVALDQHDLDRLLTLQLLLGHRVLGRVAVHLNNDELDGVISEAGIESLHSARFVEYPLWRVSRLLLHLSHRRLLNTLVSVDHPCWELEAPRAHRDTVLLDQDEVLLSILLQNGDDIDAVNDDSRLSKGTMRGLPHALLAVCRTEVDLLGAQPPSLEYGSLAPQSVRAASLAVDGLDGRRSRGHAASA
ncbi:hypothetical protein PFISCL1PPCAC_23759, partial [Pristionchus fissidentatus]